MPNSQVFGFKVSPPFIGYKRQFSTHIQDGGGFARLKTSASTWSFQTTFQNLQAIKQFSLPNRSHVITFAHNKYLWVFDGIRLVSSTFLGTREGGEGGIIYWSFDRILWRGGFFIGAVRGGRAWKCGLLLLLWVLQTPHRER